MGLADGIQRFGDFLAIILQQQLKNYVVYCVSRERFSAENIAGI
jgi:hypothetical protein